MQNTQPQIVIDFLPDGTMKREVLNAQGTSCQDLTKPLDAIARPDITYKPEYFLETVTETIATTVGA
jgi:Protein of unknown function (DUF2997)